MKRTKFALLIFLVSFVLYALTLAPSLGTGSGAAWVVNSLASGLPPAPGNILYLLVSAVDISSTLKLRTQKQLEQQWK